MLSVAPSAGSGMERTMKLLAVFFYYVLSVFFALAVYAVAGWLWPLVLVGAAGVVLVSLAVGVPLWYRLRRAFYF